MPIFEWSCIKCEKVHEAYVSQPKEFEETTCPFCGEQAKRVPSRFTIRMDGRLMTEGGPVHQDQRDDIGLLDGDKQEDSAKQISDYRQSARKGKGMDYVFGED